MLVCGKGALGNVVTEVLTMLLPAAPEGVRVDAVIKM